jgi:hypothetical protein
MPPRPGGIFHTWSGNRLISASAAEINLAAAAQI